MDNPVYLFKIPEWLKIIDLFMIVTDFYDITG